MSLPPPMEKKRSNPIFKFHYTPKNDYKMHYWYIFSDSQMDMKMCWSHTGYYLGDKVVKLTLCYYCITSTLSDSNQEGLDNWLIFLLTVIFNSYQTPCQDRHRKPEMSKEKRAISIPNVASWYEICTDAFERGPNGINELCGTTQNIERVMFTVILYRSTGK